MPRWWLLLVFCRSWHWFTFPLWIDNGWWWWCNFFGDNCYKNTIQFHMISFIMHMHMHLHTHKHPLHSFAHSTFIHWLPDTSTLAHTLFPYARIWRRLISINRFSTKLLFNTYFIIQIRSTYCQCKIFKVNTNDRKLLMLHNWNLPKTFSWWTFAIPVQLIYDSVPLLLFSCARNHALSLFVCDRSPFDDSPWCGIWTKNEMH